MHDTAKHQSGSSSTASITDKQAEEMLQAYLQIKNALINTDGSQAKKAADQLLAALEGNTDELIEDIRTDCRHISGTEDVAHQRMHFENLSDELNTLVKSTHTNSEPMYRMYCPMAFNNKGAYWLSAEKEVNNPYFGDKMLHCGKVEEVL
jgi:hypothetical protein